MKRDPLFFRLFKDLPGCFFQLVGRPDSDAERYRLEAIEYKATAVRLDGVFLPVEPQSDPAYIWEAQFYASDTVYANLWTKIGRFLEHGDPNQNWIAVVIYPSRSVEQTNIHPYRCLLASDQLVRIYLDELPPARPDQFELGILELIAAKPEPALEKARAMVPLIQNSNQPRQFQQTMIQFIETVIVHQFPNWSREEIERMLQVTDVTQTRVYQEALEEGRREGIETGIEKGKAEEAEKVARRLLKMGLSITDVAKATKLSPSQIRKLGKSN